MADTLDLAEFINVMPKVELHLHLMGAVSLDTTYELAQRHPDRGVPTDLAELRQFRAYGPWPRYVDVFCAVNDLVLDAADLGLVIVNLARDLTCRGVRYAEVTVTPMSHLQRGMAADELAEALTVGRRRALAEHGVDLGWIFDFPGNRGELAEPTADWALRYLPAGSVGFGLGGREIGVPREWFRDVFARMAESPLHLVPHAGEAAGSESVWAAVRELGAERIGHGIGAADDPALLVHLAEREIPLEVCLTSNVRTGAVASYEAHPLPVLLASGVLVTLASDDPALFETDLVTEYLLCHREFGFSRAELVDLARTGIAAAFCDDDTRRRLADELAEFERRSTDGGT